MLASQIMLSLTGSEGEITANHICRTANINIDKRIVKHAVQLATLPNRTELNLKMMPD